MSTGGISKNSSNRVWQHEEPCHVREQLKQVGGGVSDSPIAKPEGQYRGIIYR